MKGGVSEETIWAIIEAYLFEVKNGAPLKDFLDLFKGAFTEEELEASLRRMEKSRWDARRGIILVCRKGMWALEALTTHAMINELELEVEDKYCLPSEWSEGEKTVLAIIAYKGPVSSSGIDEVMGIDCNHYVVSLQERGLVVRKNNKFTVTPSFFGFFGLKDSSELPFLGVVDSALSQNDSKNEEMNFSHFDGSLIEESEIGFDYQWSKRHF
ncbi:MAG: SMC-Scp complex subunit ScpB [Oligoflexia bacterium]|nr:SMC-Scp complex subunit ScpB [Oligoflexia bacterium]